LNQSNQQLVSVVIPCYNHERFVQDSIQSVIDQTYQNIELIIIDDGSKDSSVEKIQEMIPTCQQRFIRFEFRHRPNKGLSATLNEALEWCQGEYFSAIASDDMMLNDKIEIQIDFLKNSIDSTIVGVFGGYNLIDDTDAIIKTILKKEKKYVFNEIFLHNFDLPAPTALLKLECVRSVGGYNENLKIEDWYMWLKLTEFGSGLLYINQPLVKYRSHDDNISKKLVLMNQERLKVLDCFSENIKYPMAKSKLEWLAATDFLYIDQVNALNQAKKLLVKKPMNLFSKNFLRFVYHALKVKK